MGFLTITNVTFAVVIIYLAFVAQKMYLMLNPLYGVEVEGPTIGPLWQENIEFDLTCFLSSKRKIATINIPSIRKAGQVLYEQRRIVYNAQQNTTDLTFLIQSEALKNATSTLSLLPSTSQGIVVNASNAIWKEIGANKTSVYLHVVLTRCSASAAATSVSVVTTDTIKAGEALHGVVGLIKHDRIPKAFRQRYLLSDFGLVTLTPEEEERISLSVDTVISYWKPEVAVRIVNDFTHYPLTHVPNVVYQNSVRKGQGAYYKPSLFVDEIGLTTDKYIPLNASVAALPLKLSFGPLSLQRWLLMANLEDSLKSQTELGFSERDLDDVRRLISETSLTLLGLTLLASLLHLLFECLAFQSDIAFWQQNKSLAGLSTRALVTDLLSQSVVFLFLIDSDTSLLVTVPTAFGLLVQAWKVQKATGLTVGRGKYGQPTLEFCRWAVQDAPSTVVAEVVSGTADAASDNAGAGAAVASAGAAPGASADASRAAVMTTTAGTSSEASSEQELTRVTLEADRFATTYLTALLLPLVVAFSLRSLLYDQHLSWYSWGIGAATSCVYTFGFALMCPQLYINHQLKSVSHLPWNFLVYKFLNTFIDDLFAFIIKMPTMHRLSVFRDDVVFLVYLYQRWVYRVDASRPAEK